MLCTKNNIYLCEYNNYFQLGALIPTDRDSIVTALTNTHAHQKMDTHTNTPNELLATMRVSA